jgi:outer membrane protein assembly factor BamB
MHRIVFRLVSGTLLLAVGAAARGQDWPRWRGPEGNGISRETQWSANGFHSAPRFFWKVSVGQGFSSIAVKGTYLYTLGNANDTDTVWCLDVETGDARP